MRDYWLTQYLLAAIGWGYLTAALIAIALALWLPKDKTGKAGITAVVIGLASILPIQGYQEYRKEREVAETYKARLAKAQALFAERCKTAGEKIYKTVENVEGVLLLKLRPKEINLSNQYRLDDPFGSDCHGEECIADLLRVTNGDEKNRELSARSQNGFSFIDLIDATDGQRYRYRAVIESESSHRLSLKRSIADSPAPPIGVTWDDISTKEDRDYWVAGGVLSVVDVRSGEVLAERRGYMIDKGQGNLNGGRSPWGFAYDNACPKFPTVSDGRAIRVGHSRKFLLSVLKSEGGK